ncbi:MAG: TetR family transcriptional regulator [Phycisphaerae bacterium]
MRAEKLNTEVRQEQIAEAALALVAGQGMKALSIARVARRVGVVPSAIYRHYRSKNEVLDAMLDLIRGRLLANVEAVCAESSDPLERLHLLLRRHIKLLRDNQGIPRVVFSQELHHGDTQRKARMYALIREYLGQVAEIACDGQRNGQIRLEFTPESIAMMYLGIVQPAALLWDFSDGNFDVTRHADQAWQILDAAIRDMDAPKSSDVKPPRRFKQKEK